MVHFRVRARMEGTRVNRGKKIDRSIEICERGLAAATMFFFTPFDFFFFPPVFSRPANRSTDRPTDRSGAEQQRHEQQQHASSFLVF
jgi:hypothetical protein